MKHKMKLKYFSWIPALLVMCIIFTYSSKTAVESEDTSSGVTYQLVQALEKVFHKNYTEEQKEKIVDKYDFLIRKIAHGLEYMVLAICIAFHLAVLGCRNKRILLLSIIIAICYASTDELHQLFVKGRSGQLKDVFIDGIGATIGSSIFMLLRRTTIK